MTTLADRLRAKRQQLSPTPTEQAPESSPVQTPPPLPPQDGALATTQPHTQQIDTAEITKLPTLEQRTVRFFTVLTQGLPFGDNPLMSALLQRLGPMLVKELEKMNKDELALVYQGMLVSLAQVFEPTAEALVIDLRQMHVMVREVDAALEGAPARAANTVALMNVAPDDLDDVIEAEVLAPPPPALPEPQVIDEDDVLVGVTMPDGSVVAMRQSQIAALRGGV